VSGKKSVSKIIQGIKNKANQNNFIWQLEEINHEQSHGNKKPPTEDDRNKNNG
jgi:hypothetical protein